VKFMLMIMTDEPAESALTPAEIDAIVAQHMAVSQELQVAGKLVDSCRLRFSAEATTLRRRGDQWLVCDGPFVESKEALGGFYLIDAASADEAIAWAKKLPLRGVGAIEIRPARTGAQGHVPIRGAEKFMVLFIANREQSPSRSAMFQAIDSHYELSLDLAVQGKFVASRSLEPSTNATTIRRQNGQYLVSDGPFAETKEFVAGYFVIACDTHSEAISWAKQLAVGSEVCEVRPVWRM
jgi:hypothetical protein